MKKITYEEFEKGVSIVPGESVEVIKGGTCEFMLENRNGEVHIRACKPETEED